jgi:hypothetical protein
MYDDQKRVPMIRGSFLLCTQAHKEDSCLEQHAPGTSSRRLKSLASYSMKEVLCISCDKNREFGY